MASARLFRRGGARAIVRAKEADVDLASLLLRFDGRINRAKYWLATVIYATVNLLLALLDRIWDQSVGFAALSFVINLGVFVSGLAVGTKRLHDRDRSAWWLLFFYLLPAVLLGWILVDVEVGSTVMLRYVSLFLALLIIWIWQVVELGCLRGTVGPNAYGPDPLAAKGRPQ
jgi:uncharacterized membrane protein YhaH (DUF805 family)